ncbi:MAG: cation diffusion facilitator family transporter [Phormidesmis sp.]
MGQNHGHGHGHGHSHGHGHAHVHSSTQNIKIAFFLNISFALLEIAGGLMTNSVAILADAVHDLGDSLSLGLAWFLQNYSERESNQQYTYGYGRFSLLGALINAVILIAGSLWVLVEAVPRLLNPEASNATGIVLLALVGIAVNGAAAFRLNSGNTLNERVITWHLLEDVLGWVAVLIAGVLLLFFDVPIIDPLLAILFTLYVLVNVLKNFRIAVSLFLQRVPSHISMDSLIQRFLQIEGVESCHHLHIWSIDGDRNVLSTHLVVDERSDRNDILRIKSASKHIVHDLNVKHLTIEIEYANEACHMA